MLPDEKIHCHYTGFTKRCKDLVVEGKCCKWVNVMGENPNTGQMVTQYACADSYAHLLLVQMAMTNNQVSASHDKHTNEMRGFRNDMREVNGLPELPFAELPRMIRKG